MIIGIDLGTTNSAAACMRENGPCLIPNSLGKVLTPSVVAFEEDGHLLVGAPAREYRVTHPERAASLFKRHMGSDWVFPVGRKKYTPEELSSLVLRSLKEDAETYLGEEVTQAVITVPAYFNDGQRKATIRAGKLAGLTVERIVNEPTAASLAYGMHQWEEDKTVVVFDLGGGTFDVSVVDLFEGMIEVRASSGVSFLGGEDFTRLLAAKVLHRSGVLFEQAEMKHPRQVAKTIELSERAKCRLSTETSTEIPLPNEQGEIDEKSPRVTVTREEFQKWSDPTLARIEWPLKRCLGDVRLKPAGVDEVILVGGATRMPAVYDRVARFFQQPPHSRLNPDQVVALGAAVQAGLIERNANLQDMVVTDVAPFTLGVEVSKEFGTTLRTGYYAPIIHRNTTIPVSRMEVFSTVRPNQTKIEVDIYQGEARRVSENHHLGKLKLSGIPPGPRGQPIHLRMTYDLNGVLEVEATIVETGRKAATVIDRHAHGLTEKEIAAAVASMQKLKTHPREEATNRMLLKSAERLYQELPQWERERLNELIDAFEEVLDMQDAEAIERGRQSLEIFLSQFDGDQNEEEA